MSKTINYGGREIQPVYGPYALMRLERQTGLSVEEFNAKMAEKPSFEVLLTFIWAGIVSHFKTLSLDDFAISLGDKIDLSSYMLPAAEAWKAAFVSDDKAEPKE